MARLGPWPKGINNLAEDHDVPRSTRENPGDACRNAINVDFADSGKAKRRKGFTKVYSGLSTKGGFSCPAGAFYIEGGWLKSFNGSTGTALCQVFGTTFTYHYLDGIVYFSDGIASKKIVDGVAYQWGMTPPAAPSVYVTSGVFGAGTYLAALCFVDGNGVESGASQVVSITAGDNAGIVFGNLPHADDQQVAVLRLYLSMPDGSELYHVADVEPGSSPYTIASGRYDDANVLETSFVSPAPAGRIIRSHNGRLFVADAVGLVWYSEPMQPDHFRLADNFLAFSSQVDIMEPVTGGIFFVYGNRTEFHAGDVEDGFSVVHKLDYGGIYGTGIRNENSVVWQSQRGTIVGLPDGTLTNVQEKNVVPDSGVSGAALLREDDGKKKFITSIKSPEMPKLAARSWIEAEVIRRTS